VRVGTCVAFGVAVLTARKWPWATNAVVGLITGTIGVAHGAADDALLSARPSAPFSKRAIGAVYGISAVAVFLAARRWPRLAKRSLFALSWVHFGGGDSAFAAACDSRGISRFAWVLRGVIPLACTWPWVHRLTNCIATVGVLDALRRGRIGDAFDLGVPTLAFALAPGSATFGAYFALWHSPRHLALAIERYAIGESLEERVAAFARAALPNTLIALGASIPLVAFAGTSRRESVDGLILAVTVPHSISVAVLEASARIF
jgi:hypothetical protein